MKKLILIMIFVVILFFGISTTADSERASKNKKPVFAIRTAIAKDVEVKGLRVHFILFFI